METKRISQVREITTLLLAGIVYCLHLHPRAQREIRQWRRRADRIPDPALRAHALHKLTGERLNPEAAALFAILAPRRHRGQLVRLMVAFQIAYDYLDAINEQPDTASLRNGLWLHRALTDAVSARPAGEDYYRHHPSRDDGGYLAALVLACRGVVRSLPSTPALETLLRAAADRCGEAQSRNHALQLDGPGQLVEWTRTQSGAGDYLWWELAAAGISCLALHALFAAAAEETTIEQAQRLDEAYFPSVCAISALLDSLIDHADDAETANHSFTGHYESSAEATERFVVIVEEAQLRLGALPAAARHRLLLAGITSFYLSAPGARREFALPVTVGTLARFGPIASPILAVMGAMRRRNETTLTRKHRAGPSIPRVEGSA